MIVRRENGDIMAFERRDNPGSWQLPQGGIDVGEEPLDAAWRELAEETGLTSREVTLVTELQEWIAYEWPMEIRATVRHGEKSRGQIQKWFLFGVLDEMSISPQPDQREFTTWKWIEPHHLIHHLIEFRQASYSRAFARILP